MSITGTLYVTYVDIDRNLLKIWGQRDKNNGKFIDEYLQQLSSKLDKIGSPESRHVQKGMSCFAQYTNGFYYRARTISNLQNERVWVFFIDYGNTEFVHISKIKIQDVGENLAKIPGQAEEFYLGRVIAPASGWTDEIINKIRNDICNNEFSFSIIAQPADQKILELKLGNEDFSSLLLKQQQVQPITISEQIQMILSYCSLVAHDIKHKLPLNIVEPNFPQILPRLGRPISSKSSQQEHLPRKQPFWYNYKKSPNPFNYSHCSTTQYSNSGQLDQMFLASNKINSNESEYYPKIIEKLSSDNVAQSYNSEHETIFYNSSNAINQTNNNSEQLLNPSNNILIEALTQQLKQYFVKDNSKNDLKCDVPHNYINSVFKVGSTHNIIVSHIDDGPWSFSVQMVSSENELNKLMEELTMVELIPLKPPLVLGHPCIGASEVYKNLCRGVIVGMSHSATKVYFVDFGNTEDLPMSSIFELPHKFFNTRVLSQKFCLSGLHKVPYSNEIKVYFKEVVSDELLMLRVTSLEGDNLPSCDLYLKNKNIKRILNNKVLESKNSVGGTCKPGDMENVVVTWIENPQRFYVQLKKRDDQLNALKEELSHVNSTGKVLTFEDLVVGLKCVCRYSSDQQWYRVEITSISSEDNIAVFYVDYGNSEIVEISSLRRIEENGLINQMSNQAVECCLQGFENKFFDQDLSKEFESLTLDKELNILVSLIDNGKLFVHLYDNSIDINILLSKSNQKIGKLTNDICKSTNFPRSELNDSQIKVSGSEQFDSYNKNEKRKKSFGNNEFLVKHESRSLKCNRYEVDKNNWTTLKEKQNLGNFSNRTKFNKGFHQDRNNQEKVMYGDKLIYNENFKNRNSKASGDKLNKDFNDRRDKKEVKQGKKFGENGKNFEEQRAVNDKSFRFNDIREDECIQGKERLKKKSTGNMIKNQRNNGFLINVDETNKSLNNYCFMRKGDVALPGAKYKKRTIDIGTTEKSIITYYINPSEFYVQTLSEEENFKKMMKEIQAYYFSLNCIQGPVKKGDVVIAQFSHDKILYRAEIEKQVPLTVRYVDYGNQEEIKVNQIWLVAKQFLNLPIQVVKCRLANIQSTDISWPNQCCQIEKFFESEEYMCTFLGCADEVYEVELKDLDTGQSVADKIIAAGYGKPVMPKLDIAEFDFSLLPTQILRLFISYVESLSKFYVILNPASKQIIEENIKNFVKDTKNLRTIEEPVLPNTFCLTSKDDIFWFRGSITSKDSEGISVWLLDRGDTVIVNSEQVKILPEYLKAIPFQAVECFLYEGKEFVSIDNLKNAIENKHMLVSIISISDEKKLSVVLYNENGNKLDFQNGDEPKFVEPVGQFPVTTKEIEVKISHFESPKEIYIQKASDTMKINSLSDDLTNFYKNNEIDYTYKTEENLVAAKSVIYDKWFRGLIINATDDSVAIFFIDFGYKENLPLQNIKKLHPSFYNVNALARKIGLNLNGNLNFNESLVGSFMGLVKEKNFLACFAKQNGEFTCDFFLDGISLFSNPIFLNNKKIDDSGTNSASECSLKVFVRHIENPKKFWVNKENVIENLRIFQGKLQEACENLPRKQSLKVCDTIAAFYFDSWYRAEILSIDENFVSVKFIDLGNIWKTGLHSLKVKALSEEFMSEPIFSTCCSLKGNLEDNSTALFKEIIIKLKNPLDLAILEEGNPTVVDLFKDGLSVSECLKEESLKQGEENEDSDFFTVYITHINSPDDFYIQRETFTNTIENILNKLSEITSNDFEDLSLIQENKIYMAQFSEDENWYRAKVLKKNEDKIEVFFVDYGNVSTVSEVKPLPPEIAEIPCLGENYSLILGDECDVWSESACAKFIEYGDGCSLKMQIVTYRAGKPIVKLFRDGKNISEELATLCENDGRIEVLISHVNSPSDFFIQYWNDISFDFITETIKNKIELENLKEFTPGNICLARCSKHLVWCRGRILRNLDEGCQVFFIDYGITEVSTELKSLPEELQKIPPRALKCKLNMEEKNISKTASEKFIGLICGGNTVFRSRIIIPGEINVISLKLKGEILERYLLEDVVSDHKIYEISSLNNHILLNSLCRKTDEENNFSSTLIQLNANNTNEDIEQEVVQLIKETNEEETINTKVNISDVGFEDFKINDEKKISEVFTTDISITDNELIKEFDGRVKENLTDQISRDTENNFVPNSSNKDPVDKEINEIDIGNSEKITGNDIINNSTLAEQKNVELTKNSSLLLHSEKPLPERISQGIHFEGIPSKDSSLEECEEQNIDNSSPPVESVSPAGSITSI